MLRERPDLDRRLRRLRTFARDVRSSEYHITNACNIRCQGCWFFEFDFDQATSDEHDLDVWREFIAKERQRGVTAALLIGGEPTLYLDRVSLFSEAFPFTTVSTNGLRALPRQEFERVAIAVTLFGGGPLDDQLRGLRPSGKRFSGLLSKALANYQRDSRAHFIFAISAESIPYIDETVQRIRDNGNRVTFNYYSSYGAPDPLRVTDDQSRLLETALAIKERYPDTVVCHPYFIRAIVTGATHFGRFGYEVCPSISVDHPDHKERLKNGHAYLPLFNSYGADARTVKFCCTSGHCDGCRDSQAVYSWLLASLPQFLSSPESIEEWLDIAESYWRQFVWSPYHG